jgi:autotransporter-associated beta strand protein
MAGTNSTGTLNVNSGTITVNKGTIGSTTNTVETRYILLGTDTGKGTINLGNGAGSTGVLATGRIIAADGSSGTGGATTAAFVFNGGTLKALGANSDWLQSTTSSTSNTNAAALTSVTTTAVSTIDSNSFAVGINSAVSGAGGFTLTDSSGTGTGVVSLGGANTYTGATTVSAGTLQVAANNALGTTAAGTSVTNGAALKLNSVNYSTAEALSLNGSGISNGGALVNSGTSTYAGQITAATNASINAGGGTLNLTGGLVKDGTTASIMGGGRVNITGIGISGASANSDLVVDGGYLAK